jgi:hypothetical protein
MVNPKVGEYWQFDTSTCRDRSGQHGVLLVTRVRTHDVTCQVWYNSRFGNEENSPGVCQLDWLIKKVNPVLVKQTGGIYATIAGMHYPYPGTPEEPINHAMIIYMHDENLHLNALAISMNEAMNDFYTQIVNACCTD